MALAIDASTPAYTFALTNVASQTSPSFAPPTGSLLAVLYANSSTAATCNKPTNTGGTISWAATSAVSEVANGCAATIWLGTVSASASLTVTVTEATGNQGDWGFGIAVITGQAATQNGATQVATSGSGTPSGTISSLVGANSLVLASVVNFSNGTVGTPGTNQTLTFNGHSYSGSDTTSGAATWAQYDTRINLGSGSSDTLNDTAPTGIAYSLAMLEILAASAAPSPRPTPIVNWPQAMWRSAYR